jgi:hypothetical protein
VLQKQRKEKKIQFKKKLGKIFETSMFSYWTTVSDQQENMPRLLRVPWVFT